MTDMYPFLFLLIIMGVGLGVFLAWTYTKKGKEWLASL